MDHSIAVGDESSKPWVSADGEVVDIDLDGDEDFLVVGCDGLWDTLEAEAVAHAVYTHVIYNPGESNDIPPKQLPNMKKLSIRFMAPGHALITHRFGIPLIAD